MTGQNRQRRQIHLLAALGLMLAAVLVAYNAFTTPPLSATAPAAVTASYHEGNRLRINKASLEELEALPGIGEAGALSIAAFRSQIGRFRGMDDLLRVPGVEQEALAGLAPYITFS